MDILLRWDNSVSAADLVLDAPVLATDGGLSTAILVSLFTDARAGADDALPDEECGLGGWCGDSLIPDGEGPLGSKLWLLRRGKRTPDTAARAKRYAEDALAWIVSKGIAASVTVDASWNAAGELDLPIEIKRPNAPPARFRVLWDVEAERTA